MVNILVQRERVNTLSEGTLGQCWWQEVNRSSDRHSSAQAPEAIQNSLSDRPLPPTPPTPRRSKLDQPSLPAADGGQPTDSATGGAPKVMAAIKSKPRSTRNAAAGTLQGPMRPSLLQRRLLLARQGAEMLRTDDHQQLLNRLLRRNPTNGTREHKTLCFLRAPKSRALRAAPVRQGQNTPQKFAQQVQHGSQGSTPSSDSEEVVIIESEHAKDSKPMSMADSQSKETMASGPHSQAWSQPWDWARCEQMDQGGHAAQQSYVSASAP